MMDIEIREVSVSRIDLSDLTFQISPPVENFSDKIEKTDLALSISAIGLLQPPILRPTGNGFSIVCGFRRIQALMSLCRTKIPARVLPESCSRLDCACMAIADNASQRPLNTVEQARSYALIHMFLKPGEDWRAVARSVGLPDSEAAKNRIMPVAKMPDSLQSAILEDRISLPVALALTDLTPDVRDALTDFLSPLSASLNVQRELTEMILEISFRDRMPVSQVIHLPELSSVLEAAEVPMPQKVRRLRQILKNMRYPAITRAEKRYKESILALNLDSRIQLQPPKDFEGTTYHLAFSIHSRQDLDALWPDMEKAALAIERAEWLF